MAKKRVRVQCSRSGLPSPPLPYRIAVARANQKGGETSMGVGFILTIVLLAVLLGICARQALATAEDHLFPQDEDTDKQPPHSNAV